MTQTARCGRCRALRPIVTAMLAVGYAQIRAPQRDGVYATAIFECGHEGHIVMSRENYEEARGRRNPQVGAG